MNIGIIGRGFVGKAVEHCFSQNKNFESKIRIFDKKKELSTHSLSEIVKKSEFIFLSVPTPANKDGSINLDFVEDALQNISQISDNNPIILLRSTVTPGISENFSQKFPNLNIVFNPEFLTERNANDDFINQSRIILGGEKELTSKVADLYSLLLGNDIPIIQTNFETAEFIKYMSNCFLATKVSFMNEMKLISDVIGADWDLVVTGFSADERIGISHTKVPGHDGKLGFGGSCFPKDIQALINLSDNLNLDSKVIKAVWKTNLELRPQKDWEELNSRAVVD
jgi:UDPglucose 6-dehydrogenase